MRSNCAAPIMPCGLGGDHRVHRHHVGLGEEVVEAVGGFGVVRVVRDHAHPESFEPPLRGSAHGTEADEAGGLTRELPGPEPLVGDRAVAPDLAGAHVEVGPDDTAVHREQQRDGHLGDAVGVAARGAQHRDARGGGGRDVDVRRVAATRTDRAERQVEHGALHGVALDDEEVGALGDDAFRELLGLVEAERAVVDPRVEHDVGEAFERLETLTAEGGGHEGAPAYAGGAAHEASFART